MERIRGVVIRHSCALTFWFPPPCFWAAPPRGAATFDQQLCLCCMCFFCPGLDDVDHLGLGGALRLAGTVFQFRIRTWHGWRCVKANYCKCVMWYSYVPLFSLVMQGPDYTRSCLGSWDYCPLRELYGSNERMYSNEQVCVRTFFTIIASDQRICIYGES